MRRGRERGGGRGRTLETKAARAEGAAEGGQCPAGEQRSVAASVPGGVAIGKRDRKGKEDWDNGTMGKREETVVVCRKRPQGGEKRQRRRQQQCIGVSIALVNGIGKKRRKTKEKEKKNRNENGKQQAVRKKRP